MAEFVRICSQAEIPAPGMVKEFQVNGRALCVGNVDGAVCVLDGTCPHEGGPLGEGSIEGGKVMCPWHAISFDVKTGSAEGEPDLKVEVYEAKVESGELRAKL
ncbi:Rieske (2Fe-2S) protein [Occallatibacter savannae]|uniref:Rieske (2Fe-2S) protein n=1 Tax=Occallatibacter savannae TaxID=1002691 RepID=UPI000D69FA71|nr:Rieske 2Fe-2S domain-containing protein [Occallatibacter savannae]